MLSKLFSKSSSDSAQALLLVGLGNPGKEYENTRHNIGFKMADAIVRHFHFPDFKLKFHGEISEGNIDGQKVIVLKPMTFMNKSGVSVAAAAKFYKIPLEKIIVFHDELDLKPAKVRIKTGGGAGGHNGIKDIDARIGKDYRRVRIGIGHPGDKDQVSNYVLHKFSSDEKITMEILVDKMAENSPLLVKGNGDLFMTRVV